MVSRIKIKGSPARASTKRKAAGLSRMYKRNAQRCIYICVMYVNAEAAAAVPAQREKAGK